MGADTAVYVHPAPLLFCAPAKVEEKSEQIKASIHEDPNVPAPWPVGSKLRIAVLSNQHYNPRVLQIIKDRAAEWFSLLSGAISHTWVESGDSEIRVSFNNDIPNWACTGVRAQRYGPTFATMNFNLGGKDDQNPILAHRHINRIATHLFGHAIGLTHAQIIWKAPLANLYNANKVKAKVQDIAADYISRDRGSFAAPSGSVMHFDLPSSLSNSPNDDRAGVSFIDDAAKTELFRLYPPPPVCYTHVIADKPDAEGKLNRAVGKMAATRITTKYTHHCLFAINRLDFYCRENWRIAAKATMIGPNDFVDVQLKGLDTTVLDAAECDVLGFESDGPLRMGETTYALVRGSPPLFTGELGKSYTRRMKWPEGTFAKPPDVVAFISGFDLSYTYELRVKVEVSNIGLDGFDLTIGTWDRTCLYSAVVTWLAYPSDHYAMRSGVIETGSDNTNAQLIAQDFKTPMRSRPRVVFRGFSYLDIPNDNNPRAAFDITDWSAQKVQTKLYTWPTNQKFNKLKGSYLAIL